MALAALVVPERHAAFKRAATTATIVFTVVAFGLIARAANLGGFIRHTEISEVSSGVPVDSHVGDGENHR